MVVPGRVMLSKSAVLSVDGRAAALSAAAGQMAAQPPVQLVGSVEGFLSSLAKKYSARPRPSTRKVLVETTLVVWFSTALRASTTP